MKVAVFTLPFLDSGGFDAEALESFSRDHEILELRDRFFEHGGRPWWAVILSYREEEKPEAQRRSKPERDPRKMLDPGEKQLYDQLRDWRGLRAHGDGVPPFLVFTNRQLAEIARMKPDTKAALESLHGVGRGKVERYYDDLRQLLDAATGGDVPAPDESMGRKEAP